MTKNLVSSINDDLLALVSPLREKHAEIQGLIEAKQIELAELKSVERGIARTLSTLDPTFAPPAKEKRVPGPARERKRDVAPDTIDDIYAWLVANAADDNGGFSAPMLLRNHNYNLTSHATLTKALQELHRQDRIRLVRAGGMGGAKFYKVVR